MEKQIKALGFTTNTNTFAHTDTNSRVCARIHTHTHTWLSDATLEGGFNLMCLMLTLVARNAHTHPLFQPACHSIS